MRAARSLVLAPLAALALAVAACSGAGSSVAPGGSAGATPASPAATGADPSGPSKASVLPVIVSTQQVVGDNRFLFSFIDAQQNTPAATPDRTASVAFAPPGSKTAAAPIPGTFIWAIENERGVYVLHATFDTAGTWTAVFITKAPDGPEERLAMTFDVAQDGSAVAVGEPAPSSDTPTADDVGGDIARLSTDPKPDPRFYTTSVADALKANKPFVLVFATPAFCQTAQCGPTLDRVKAVAKDYPDTTFINVEPYQLQYTEGRLQPKLDANGQLQPVQSVLDYGILTEPWVYVVDGEGIVRGSFEGIFAEQELRQALDAVAS